MDFRLNQPGSFHWLWLVVVLAGLLVVAFHRRRVLLHAFAEQSMLRRLVGRISPARQLVRAGLMLLALVALVGAMADPRWGVEYEEVQQQGIDIVVLLDISRSMLAEDARPNRLERAKQMIRDTVERLGGDRIGLITFAGNAAVRCPLTVDYGAFLLSLDEVDTEDAVRGGSMLGDAIRLANDAFTDDVKEHKALLVFSDGEDMGSYPLEAAQKLYEDKGARIYTIGLGDSQDGARIPIMQGNRRTYVTHEGQIVWSKMNEEVLRDIAVETGGAFVPAGTQAVDMGQIFDEVISAGTKRTFDTGRIKRYQVRYHWFAGLAFALIVAESLIGATRSQRSGSREAPA